MAAGTGLTYSGSTLNSVWTTSGNNIYKNNSANVGIGTSSPSSLLHTEGGNFLVTGTYGSGNDIEVSGAGTRLFFNPKKAAFRAGYVSGDKWDNSNLGNYSGAFGGDTKASGNYSFATGLTSTASGVYSVALGNNVTASKDYSFAQGYFSNASGVNGVAIGYGAVASGDYTIAMGSSATAKSYGEVVLGLANTSYTPSSTTDWVSTDRLLTIGNGIVSNNLFSDALTILKSGNTGIGTSSPTEKLEVSGKTKTTTFQMTKAQPMVMFYKAMPVEMVLGQIAAVYWVLVV